ncbi:MAG: PP2C family protein-serine/threonine phosphatase [Terriglobia bacterium]|jgi:serine phosphatase RsbU (regulator of sigma subunit)
MFALSFGILLQVLAHEAAVEQLRRLLRADALNVLLGVVFAVAGVGALTLATIYRRGGGHLLSFGLLSTLYGLRLLARMPSIQILFGLPPSFGDFSQTIISDVILIPAVMFFYQTVNLSWQRLIRWQFWFFGAYAVAAISIDLASHSPGRAPDPANFLLIIAPATFFYGLFSRRLRLTIFDRPETRVLAAGTGVSVLTVINERLVSAQLVPWQWRPEPLGFLAFTVSLGYVAARRFFASQQELVAVAREMAAARKIQTSILPQQVPAVAGLRVAVRYVPMAAVAGDFYDFLVVDDRRLGILVADTIGHGVPAALVASMIKVAFAAQADHAGDPATLLSELNRIFCRQGEGQFITASYLFLDLEGSTALYAGAGHPPLLLRRAATGRVEECEVNGPLLGFRATAIYSHAGLKLCPGDRILMYTDGITEASSRADELFGGERLKEFLAKGSKSAPDGFAEDLLRHLATWSGANSGRPQGDDLTLLVIDIES